MDFDMKAKKERLIPSYDEIYTKENLDDIRKQEAMNNQKSTDVQRRYNTLRESILDTLLRDLSKIYLKLKVVIIPNISEEKIKELKQWDLWGPFLMCLILGIILSLNSTKNSGLVFSSIFVIIYIGSTVITINNTLLGGNMSFMQCICLLGYCTFPIDVAALLIKFVLYFLPSIIKLAIVVVAFIWSTKASVPFIAQNIDPKKQNLAVYPVMLFFMYLSWFILA